MLERRKFLKISSLVTLAFSFLPSIFFKNSAFSAPANGESLKQTKNWLCGSSKKGCSTSGLALDYHGSLEDGLDDFLNFRLPTEFPNTNVIV
jgi:anaerobic selenocysteine-containing dehydrogenase